MLDVNPTTGRRNRPTERARVLVLWGVIALLGLIVLVVFTAVVLLGELS
jgi:hypothetical protein